MDMDSCMDARRSAVPFRLHVPSSTISLLPTGCKPATNSRRQPYHTYLARYGDDHIVSKSKQRKHHVNHERERKNSANPQRQPVDRKANGTDNGHPYQVNNNNQRFMDSRNPPWHQTTSTHFLSPLNSTASDAHYLLPGP